MSEKKQDADRAPLGWDLIEGDPSTEAILVRLPNGWGLDLSATPEAEKFRSLFGTAVLPLPLTDQCSRDDARHFALTTEMGRLYGVRPTDDLVVLEIRSGRVAFTVTLADFAKSNCDAPDIVAQARTLRVGNCVTVGGGAAPVFTVTRKK